MRGTLGQFSALSTYFVCVHIDVFVCACNVYLVTHLCACVSHREAKATVQGWGEPVLGYIDAYYEDHIHPVTGSYVEWASDVKSSVWEKIQTTIDNYRQLKGTNSTDQPSQS